MSFSLIYRKSYNKVKNLISFHFIRRRDFFNFLIVSSLVKLIPLLILPVLLKKSGSDGFQLLIYFEIAFLIFQSIYSIQNVQIINRFYYEWPTNKRIFKTLLIYERVIFTNLLFLVISLFLVFFAYLINNQILIVLSLSSIFSTFYVISQFPLTFHRIQNNAYIFLKFSLIILFIEFFPFLFFSMFYEYSILIFLLIKTLGYSIYSVLIVYKIYKLRKLSDFKLNSINNETISIEFQYGKNLIVYQVFNLFYNNIDKVLLTLVSSPSISSSYFIVSKLLSPISILYSILKDATTSIFYKLHSNYFINIKKIRILNFSVLAALIFGTLAIFILLPQFFSLLNFNKILNQEVYLLFYIISFNIIHQAINLYYFPGFFYSKNKNIFYYIIIKCIMYLAVSLIFFNYFGIYSIPFGLTFSELAFSFISYVFSVRVIDKYRVYLLDLIVLVFLYIIPLILFYNLCII
jgi:hypothetical protein